MDEWHSGKLADFCESIDYGLTASANTSQVGPHFLRITDIVGSALDWDSVPFVAADLATAEKYRLYDGDIVIARTGATTGESRYIQSPPPAVFASYLVRLKVHYSVDARYISYWLKSPAFRGYLSGVLGDKSAQPNASASTMTQAPIRLPADKKYQAAISSLLGVLDDKIELNRQTNETLEALARALFKDWFVDFGPTRAKAEGCPAYLAPELWALFPDALDDEDKPVGWLRGAVGQYMLNFDSKRVPVSGAERAKRRGPFPYHGATGVMDHVDDYLFDGVYLLVGEDGSVVRENGLAFTQYVWGKIWVNNHAHVLQGKGSVSTEQLLLHFQHEPVTPYITGAVQLKLSQGRMNSMPFVHAGDEISQKFSELVDPLFVGIRANLDQNITLAQTRDLLLPKFMSGEIRLREAENIVEAVL